MKAILAINTVSVMAIAYVTFQTGLPLMYLIGAMMSMTVLTVAMVAENKSFNTVCK